MDDLLTTKELLDLLKIDRTTVYRMLSDGRLSGIKVGGQWRFSRKQVEALLSGTLPAEEKGSGLNAEVLPVHCLQAIQNVFAEVASVGSVTTVPDGEPLTQISNSCEFCNLVLASPEGRAGCVASWRRLAAQRDDRPEFATCHAGLQYARARIEIRGTLIAMLVAGQFYSDAPEADEAQARVARLASAYHIDEQALAAAARALPVLDARMRARIADWLQDVAHTFEEVGRERAELLGRLRRIAEMSALETNDGG